MGFLSFEHKACFLSPLLPHIPGGGENRVASRDVNARGVRAGRKKAQLPVSSMRGMLSWAQGVLEVQEPLQRTRNGWRMGTNQYIRK